MVERGLPEREKQTSLRWSIGLKDRILVEDLDWQRGSDGRTFDAFGRCSLLA